MSDSVAVETHSDMSTTEIKQVRVGSTIDYDRFATNPARFIL